LALVSWSRRALWPIKNPDDLPTIPARICTCYLPPLDKSPNEYGYNPGMPMNMALARSSNSYIAGVCGGLAEWLEVDPTLVRITFALVSLFTGCMPGFFLYVLLWLMMPAAGRAPAVSPRLTRSSRHSMIGGVCGGFADWLGWDPTAVRILYVVVSIFSAAFPGTLVYIILWILMPRE
jgi:phage shock protein PspC (stress-responsive transcriptional regulator)